MPRALVRRLRIGPIVPPEWRERARADFSASRVCMVAVHTPFHDGCRVPLQHGVADVHRRLHTPRARRPHRAASAASEYAPPEYPRIPVLPPLRVKARQ
ncbi:MAG: hypothetical protein ACK56I_26950, partial [bacterium]